MSVGDTIHATILSADQGRGAVYVDVVKDRQTMLTQAAEVEDGRATVDISITPSLTGSVWLNAYRIQGTGDIIRDTAPVFVDPASDLSVEVSSDAETYRPGADATVDFTVRDAKGRPVAAALGINVVDESVFALQELKPGMEKVYFYLEQELMKPRVEIHEFEMPLIIAKQPPDRPADMKRERAAMVLLAGAEMPDAPGYRTDTYANRVQTLKDEWAKELGPTVQKLGDALHTYIGNHGKSYAAKLGAKPLVDEGLIEEKDLLDQWGQPMLVEPLDDPEQPAWMLVLHAIGPDGRVDTGR